MKEMTVRSENKRRIYVWIKQMSVEKEDDRVDIKQKTREKNCVVIS